MNRTANAIRMLRYLRMTPIAKKREIAEYLEIKERYVLELKYELETAGYTIETMNGKHGGYRLVDKDSIAQNALTPKMREALVQAAPFLLSLQEPMVSSHFKEAYRIISGSMPQVISPITSMTQKWPLTKSSLEIEKLMDEISFAILERLHIQILYKPQSREAKVYLIEPRELVLYDGQWYVLAQDLVRKVTVYKLSRIETIARKTTRFVHDSAFQASKTLTPYGFNVDQPIRCKLKITQREYMSEYMIGENQVITWLDDQSFILEATIRAKRSLLELILQLGTGCEVLEPEFIRSEIVRIYQISLKNYQTQR